MFTTISRPHFDEFSYQLFDDLLATVSDPYQAYYLWATPPETLPTVLLNIADNHNEKNIILGIKDLLDLWKDYNHWHQSAHAGTQLLDQVAQNNPDKNFVVCTSLENLHLENIQAQNIQIVPWGGDWTNQHAQYQQIEPVLDKNFSSDRHWISLNRNTRDHRLVFLSYLFGLELDQYGFISYLSIANIKEEFEPDNFLDRIFWEFDESRHDRIRETMFRGYTRFYNDASLVRDDFEIYGESCINDNINNFERNLREKYRNSFLEIVTESSFTSPGFLLTEKTRHAFVACNFPIFLFGQYGVAHLRDIGFDVFDDIINHSYDTIANPFDRITSAIDSNQHLLTDGNLVKQLWLDNRDRFIHNFEVSKTIDQYYRTRAERIWSEVRWN